MNKHYFKMKLMGHKIFLGDFEDEQDVINSFEETQDVLNGAYILLAHYEVDGYEGSAFVLFERDGKFYEVNGGHCSCNGLEGQWEPEETSANELVHRIKNGRLGVYGYGDDNAFGQELLKVLEG